jgi:hypothetical protein
MDDLVDRAHPAGAQQSLDAKTPDLRAYQWVVPSVKIIAPHVVPRGHPFARQNTW